MKEKKARLADSRLWRIGVILIAGIIVVGSCTRLTQELIRTQKTPQAMSAADFALVAGEEAHFALADIDAALGGLGQVVALVPALRLAAENDFRHLD